MSSQCLAHLVERVDPRIEGLGLVPADSVDHVLIVISYHEFSHPVEMMRHVRKAMKRDGSAPLYTDTTLDRDVAIKVLPFGGGVGV